MFDVIRNSAAVKAQVGYWRNRTQTYQNSSDLLAELLALRPLAHARQLLTITDLTRPDHPDLYTFYQCHDNEACAGPDRLVAGQGTPDDSDMMISI